MIIIQVFLESKDDPGQEDEAVSQPCENIWGAFTALNEPFRLYSLLVMVLAKLSSAVHTPMKTDHVVILLSEPNELLRPPSLQHTLYRWRT